MRIAHLGTYDVANYGDLLFPLVAAKRLASLGAEILTVAPRGGPAIWRDCAPALGLGSPEVEDGPFDGILLGGGNLVHVRPWNEAAYDSGGSSGLLAYPRLWLGAAQLAERFEAALCWNAPGVHEPPPPALAPLLRWAAGAADYLAVRDHNSARNLQGAAPDRRPLVVPDPALDVATLWSADELDAAYTAAFVDRGRPVPPRTVALHLNSRYAPSNGEEAAAYVARVAAALDATPVLIALAPCHGDDVLARAVAAASPDALAVLPTSLREAAALIGRSEAYVGSSMHGFVTATAFGTPGLIVGPQDRRAMGKFDGLLEQLSLQDRLETGWAEAAERLPAVLEEPADRLEHALEAARPLLDAHWRRIGEVLTRDPATRRSRSADLQRLRPEAPYAAILGHLVREEREGAARRETAQSRQHDAELRRVQAGAERLVETLRGRDAELEELQAIQSAHGRDLERLEDRLRKETELRSAETRRQVETTARATERVRELQVELRRAGEALERASASRSWRWGHGAARAVRRMTLRPPVASAGGIEMALGRVRSVERQLAELAAFHLDPPLPVTPPTADTRPPGAVRQRRGRTSVTVVSWDMSHNPLGRAYVLADVLRETHDVEIVGASFPRYGTGIWSPLADSPVPMRLFPGREFPQHWDEMERMAASIQSDAIILSKPRFPSLGIGILAKQQRNRPLLLDCDDSELSFFGGGAGIQERELQARREDPDFGLPFGETWTRFSESLIGHADQLTVSNGALQERYGGLIVPHARDERIFDPALYDRRQARERLGLPQDRTVLLFAGTPRAHKGIVRLAEALAEVAGDTAVLCIVGTVRDARLAKDLGRFPELVRLLPDQSFAELPVTLAAADATCVLQDPASEVARWQMPAKVTDALAMGVPVLTTDVQPLAGLIAEGVLESVGADELPVALARFLDALPEHRARAQARREVFLERMSYAAVRPVLTDAINALLADPPPLPAAYARAAALRPRASPPGAGPAGGSTSGLAPAARADPGASPAPTPAKAVRGGASSPYDLVVFWKQNDTGIYGRRQDMLIKYLARSERVRQIVHFDHPIDARSLLALRTDDRAHHGRLVFRQTMQRALGRQDGDKITFHSFVHRSSEKTRHPLERLLPPKSEYAAYVALMLERQGVRRGRTVFLVYPRNFDFPELAEVLDPDLVVADVVDDHRAWASSDPAYAQRLTDNYEQILGLSDVVLANCESVRQAMRPFAEEIALLPNASEPPDPGRPRGDRPGALAHLTGPIVAYAGNLSSRLDLTLLERLAGERPDYQLVLIGSAHLDRQVLRLDERPNVTFLGVRPYDELLQILDHVDVGLIPHLDDDMTRSMNPLKAFVYCGRRVPVVSTRVANLDEMAGLIDIAEDHDDFMTKVDAAVRRGRTTPSPDAMRILEENSWPVRVELLLDLIDEHTPTVAAPAVSSASTTGKGRP